MTDFKILSREEVKTYLYNNELLAGYMLAYKERAYIAHNAEAYELENKALILYCIAELVIATFPQANVAVLQRNNTYIQAHMSRIREYGYHKGVLNYKNNYVSPIDLYTRTFAKITDKQRQKAAMLFQVQLKKYNCDGDTIVKEIAKQQEKCIKQVGGYLIKQQENSNTKEDMIS